MAELDQIDIEIAAIEELEAWRSRLRHIEAGGSSWPGCTADEVRRFIADLEAKVASFPKE